MKHMIIILTILLITTLAFAQYKIPHSVIGSGGAVIANSSHRINGTVGQNIIGSASGSSFSSGTGFWYLQGRIMTDVEQIRTEMPDKYFLNQNYPNPFNPSTNIKFNIPKTSYVTLKIFNMLGQEVAELVNEEKQPGVYEVNWNASGFASSVYFYKLIAKDIATHSNQFLEVKKLILIK